MGNSLLNQFQGSLLGISLGLLSQWLTDYSPPTKEAISPGQPSKLITVPNHSLTLISSWTNSLITQQGINREDWQQIWQTHQNLLSSTAQLSSDSALQYEYLGEIAALPMMLFLHENSEHQRQQLQTLSQFWQGQSSDTSVELLAFCQIIAELLKYPAPNLHQLIPNILSQLPPETQLAQQLTQVQTLLQQHRSQTSVISSFKSNSSGSLQFSSSLAIAVYCFLSTPNAFSVSVQRAMRMCPDSSLTSGIVGALSGTYNGLAGIPTPWQLKLRRLAQLNDVTSIQAVTTIIPTDKYIINQATQLFQVWAGLYSVVNPDANPLTSLIVAAPLSLPD
jgi:hypothetical protein